MLAVLMRMLLIIMPFQELHRVKRFVNGVYQCSLITLTVPVIKSSVRARATVKVCLGLRLWLG